MFKNHKEFSKKYWELFKGKKFEEALDMLKNIDKNLPEDEIEKNKFEIMAKEIYVYIETKNVEKCITALKSIHREGYPMIFHWGWFKFLKDHPEYEEVEKRNWELHRQLNENTELKYDVLLPKGYNQDKKHPVFFCLHGDGGECTKEGHKIDWKPDSLLEKGYIVVYPQSSQAYCYNGYGWLDNPELSRKELKECYDKVAAEYPIDTEKVVIGGFSGGATAAIDSVYKDEFPAKGVVSLMPGDYLGNMEINEAKSMAHREVKLYIMEGELGLDPVVPHILEVLKGAGVKHEYTVINGIGHSCPEDLGQRTVEALEYIFNR